MIITKHGIDWDSSNLIISFICRYCGCKYTVNGNEFRTSCKNKLAKLEYIRLIMTSCWQATYLCPDCGMISYNILNPVQINIIKINDNKEKENNKIISL